MTLKERILNSNWIRFWLLNQRCSKCRFVGDTLFDRCHNKKSPYHGYHVDSLEGDPSVCILFERSLKKKTYLEEYTDEQFRLEEDIKESVRDSQKHGMQSYEKE